MQIAAVVVSCNVVDCLTKTLAALTPQVASVIVVDNASDDGTRAWLQEWLAEDVAHRSVMLREDKNLGKAQNLGIAHALGQGVDAVLLMDHDSIAAPDMVAELAQAFSPLPNPLPPVGEGSFADGKTGEGKLVAITAPYLLDIHSARLPRYPRARGKWRAERVGCAEGEAYLDGVMGVIASGSLIPRATFERVGLMDEDFSVDYIDKDFCLRVVRLGFNIRVVRAAVLYHELGKASDHTFCGVRMTSTNHSPERIYTITRNRVRCWMRHGVALPAFVIYDAAAMLYDIIKIILLEQNKTPKLRAVARGLCFVKP